MYFEDLSMRSGIKMAGFARQRRLSDKCSLCFAGFTCKLAASLVNGININVHSITLHLIVLVFELRACEHCSCELTRILKWYFTVRKEDGS